MARELLTPTLFSLLGLTAVVLTRDLLGYSDLVINRGLGVQAVLQIAFFQVVPLVTLILPMAVLMGVLVAMGRLGADLEILVLETLGVRATRLAGPIGLFALVCTLLCFFLSVFASPWASRSLDHALSEMAKQNPAATVRAGIINRFGDWLLEAREVSPKGDEMKNVLLWLPSLSDTIFAQRGLLTANADGDIKMTLENGRLLLYSETGTRHVEFERLETVLPENERPMIRGKDEVLQGLTLAQLREIGDEVSETDSRYPRATVEAHRRIATPITALLFGLFAIPLFLTRREYSRSAGGMLGMVTIVSYFGLVQLGDGLIQNGRLSAAMGVWLPNIVVAALAAWLFSNIARKGVFGREVDRMRGGRSGKRESKRSREPRRRALPRYVAGQFIKFSLLSFGVLLAVYLLIDILDRLQWFAKHQAPASTVVRFYGARIPVLASRIIPMSLLVGTALTSSHLAVHGELIGMRSLGIPAPKALLPVLVLCTFTVPLFFALSNELMPRASALQDRIKETEIRPDRFGKNRPPPVWYRVGDDLNQVGLMDDAVGVAEEITVYELARDGLPVSRTDADSARHLGRGNWRLEDAKRIELVDGEFAEVDSPDFAQLGKSLPAKVDTMHFSIGQLRGEIRDVEKNDLDATALRVDLHVKLSNPWACIVLPAIVLFFAVGGPPFPASATTLLVSGVLGIGYVLLTGTAASLGYSGVLSPVAAGWGPTALLATLAAYMGLRLRPHGQPLIARARQPDPDRIHP